MQEVIIENKVYIVPCAYCGKTRTYDKVVPSIPVCYACERKTEKNKGFKKHEILLGGTIEGFRFDDETELQGIMVRTKSGDTYELHSKQHALPCRFSIAFHPSRYVFCEHSLLRMYKRCDVKFEDMKLYQKLVYERFYLIYTMFDIDRYITREEAVKKYTVFGGDLKTEIFIEAMRYLVDCGLLEEK